MTSSTTSSLRVPVGHTFPLLLAANPSTGYQWELSTPVDPRFLVLLSNQYVPNERSERVGQSGHQVLLFQSLHTGMTSIALKYCRPWDTGDCAAFAFYTVEIF